MNDINQKTIKVYEYQEPESNQYDAVLFLPVLFLVGIGIVMVYSASSTMASEEFGSQYFFVKKQVIFSLIGIAAMITSARTPLKILWKIAYPLLLLSLILLCAIQMFNFLRITAGGASRWINLGFFSCQPSELARFAIVIYLAYSLTKKQEKLDDFTIGFLPHLLIVLAFTALIVVQPDFGSVIIIAAVAWVMMFIGGVRIGHLMICAFGTSPFLYYLLIGESYRLQRILSFLDPWKYASDSGYQTVHSLMAFGSGGICGAGIGDGFQKLFYLPESHTDFIFSIIGEELGLIGVFVILCLYGVIIYRGFQIALKQVALFPKFLAIGLTTTLAIQICVNMGVALALLPTKGLALPFLSYGGTSLLLNMLSIGILMKISSTEAK